MQLKIEKETTGGDTSETDFLLSIKNRLRRLFKY